jgi:sugar lactone lactonase YvrE
MRRLTAIAALLLALALPAATGAAAYPDRIDLPDEFAPEGIAVGRGHTFYVGSLAGAGIWRGDLRTGEGEPLVEGGGPFVGMDVDAHSRLWVAGGPVGVGYVFDARTGAPIETFALADPPAFINDVVVTRDAAWFTDSFNGVVYRVGVAPNGAILDDISELDLTSLAPAEPSVFRLNGIDATPDGGTLIVANSTDAELYVVDTASGAASTIALPGMEVVAGDGILLHGRTLYVVARNAVERIAVIELAPDLVSGTVVDEITSDDFDVPTTVAGFGSSLYVVNARFGTLDDPAGYWVTRVDR